MKKRVFFLALAVVVLAACHAGGTQETKTAAEPVVTEQQSSDELVKRVEDIFKTVFKVYIYEDSLRNLDKLEGNPTWENRNRFNADFCSSGFNDLLGQVNEIDSLYHSGELGFFDADYWIMAQDYSSELHVSDVTVVSMDGTGAVVDMKINDFGSARPVRLKMVFEDGQWKIDSFIDSNYDFDLKKSMEEYVSNELKANKQ